MKFGNKGFTLIEVICSIFILGLALVALQQMVSSGFKSNAITEQRLIAYNLLEWEMEYLQSVDFDELYGIVPPDPDVSGYNIDVAVVDTANNLYTINVTISGTNAFDQLVEAISTYRANY